MVEVFKTKTRAEWCAIMEGTDVCFAPVLTMSEAPEHPHMAARKIFVSRHGVTQPAPAPRFSRTPSAIREAVTADIASLTSEWKGGR
jgi:alpha-methylacyl-CoA racemase